MRSISSYLWAVLLGLILLSSAPTLFQSIKTQYTAMLNPKTKVGRIKINDEIDNTKPYQAQIEKIFKNNEIKAVLFEIESPGGAAGSTQCLFQELLYYKAFYKKPVVVLIPNLCASGAYYIACAGDYIIAAPSALIGSIGCYIGQFKLGNTIKLVGAEYELAKTGDYKATTCAFTPTTPEQKKMLQDLTDDTYQQFVNAVAQQRKLSTTHATQWANGKIFTGAQALKLGLIDALGSEHTAVEKIKELALIGRDIEWVEEESESWLTQLARYAKNPLLSLLSAAQISSTNYPRVHY